MVKTLSLLLLTIIISSCDGNKTAGTGGVTETTNGLSVSLVDNENNKMTGQTVYLLNGERWATKLIQHDQLIIDSAITNSKGEATLRYDNSIERAYLYCVSGNLGLRTEIIPSDTNLLLQLDSLSEFEFVLPDSNSVVYLEGVPNSIGTSGLVRLPKGEYSTLVTHVEEGARRWNPGGKLWVPQMDTFYVKENENKLILEDFDDLDIKLKWFDLFDQGFWWMKSYHASFFNDAGQEETDFSNLIRTYKISGLLDSINGIKMVYDSISESDNYGNFGVDLKFSLDEDKGRSMATVDTIRILAEIKGNWMLFFYGKDDQACWFELPESNYSEIAISTDEFTCSSTNLTSLAVHVVLFQTNQKGSILLDKIVLDHLDLGTWLN